MNPVHLKTREVVQRIYKQNLPLFKDKYVPGGEGEVSLHYWSRTDSVTEYMDNRNITRAHQGGFNDIMDVFTDKQRTIIPTCRENTHRLGTPAPPQPLLCRPAQEHIIQLWTSETNIKAATLQEFRVITDPASYWYLDCGFGGWIGNQMQDKSWCTYVHWQKSYSFNPVKGLTPEEAKLVLSGEVFLWGEQVDETNIDGCQALATRFCCR